MSLILGIDPGLQKTGWGIIECEGNRLRYVASGLLKTNPAYPLYARLAQLDAGMLRVLQDFSPHVAAIEETFVNKNPSSALKLGLARGVVMVCPARMGLEVAEYAANLIKKSVVGSGHASKEQISMMIRTLLPHSGKVTEDEADALAIAICHAHHSKFRETISSLKG